MLPIALAHGTGSPEWQAEVDATAPRLHDETFARARLLIAALCSCLGFCILTSPVFRHASLAAKTVEQWRSSCRRSLQP
jgi:hypothetical protein